MQEKYSERSEAVERADMESAPTIKNEECAPNVERREIFSNLGRGRRPRRPVPIVV